MPLIAGVDVGNRTTEVAMALKSGDRLDFLSTALVETTGIKGSAQNAAGIQEAIRRAIAKTAYGAADIDLVCINDAVPVIGDLAMATLTETIITESAMIGHNPATPGGVGIGAGETVRVQDLAACVTHRAVIAVVPGNHSFNQAAAMINQALARGVDVRGAIIQNDDGVLIANRINRTMPIVDEIDGIQKVPLGMPAVAEVAAAGRTISELCNPYGIATHLGLDSRQTRQIAPIAITLIGNRSAVVIKTPSGGIRERRIPAGRLTLEGRKYTQEIDLLAGGPQIMAAVEKNQPLADVHGEAGTSVAGMLAKIKKNLGKVCGRSHDSVTVRDVYAVDTIVPQKVQGGIAGEYSINKAVGLAAMVWTDESLMKNLVARLHAELQVPVRIGGTEVCMACLGALTTPGVQKPLVILDLGAGSIDAAHLDRDGNIDYVHLAGAGDMVSMLIDSELGLKNPRLAEEIKINPAAKVESLFHIRLEDGSLRFFDEPLGGDLFGRVVLLKNGTQEMLPVEKEISLQLLVSIRQQAKKKVFIGNIKRALERIMPGRNIRLIDEIVLLGGCALDFELPGFISQCLLRDHGVVTGSGNVRGLLGPRNAVATGLVLSYAQLRDGSPIKSAKEAQ